MGLFGDETKNTEEYTEAQKKKYGEIHLLIIILALFQIWLGLYMVFNWSYEIYFGLFNPHLKFEYKFIPIIASVSGLIAGGIMLFFSRYSKKFIPAGLLYLYTPVMILLRETVIKNRLGLLPLLLSGIFGLIYIVYFSSGMGNLFIGVDYKISDTWRTYRNANFIAIGLPFVCLAVLFVPINYWDLPFINVLAWMAIFVCLIALAGIFVWKYVLLLQSAICMKKHSK